MRDRKVDVQSKVRVYSGFQSVDEAEVRFEKQDGSMSAVVRRSSVERGDAVAVLIYVRDGAKLLFARQFRLPLLRHGDPFPLEIIAGGIDEGETPEHAALREVREEAGLELSSLEKLAEFYGSPGGLSEKVYIFWAETPDYKPPLGAVSDGDEDVEIISLPVEEARKLLLHGGLADGKTQVALFRFLSRS